MPRGSGPTGPTGRLVVTPWRAESAGGAGRAAGTMTGMAFRLFDTAHGEVREVVLRKPDEVSIYVCGPTVYDYPHVGHGRSVITYDVLRRYLEYRGYVVRHVSNITDIEDKIINRAKLLGIPCTELTATYEAEWYKAMDKLGALRPHHAPHATEYVDEMIQIISDLIKGGFAYETDDTIYFSPAKVDDYGLLARQSIESLQAGARVEQDSAKQTPIDFALWKKVASTDDEPTWTSPWGTGRPGWHTECVVMSLGLLGDGFDIHSGGLDLTFPHHENERAQAIAWGHDFAHHWMHHGFIEVDGEKMSKSLGNFTSLTDLIERHDPRAYRLLLLRSHYRSPLELTPDTMTDAEAALQRIDDFTRRFTNAETTEMLETEPLVSHNINVINEFCERMDDDLDTPNALASLFTAMREANFARDEGDHTKANNIARAVVRCFAAVGLESSQKEHEVDNETQVIIDQRDLARAARDWAAADRYREQLQQLGWTVEDTPDGTTVHK